MLTKCHIASIVISVALIIGGIVLVIGDYMKTFIDKEVNSQIVISLDSPEFDDWMTPPPPIYMQYWLFNVTNPEDVISGGKANVTEIGPFTYRLYQPRYNAIFYQNWTVSYQYNHTLVYQPTMSYGDPNDVMITNLNVPILTIIGMIKKLHLSPFIVSRLIELFGENELFVPHTAHDWLFGYTDELLSLAHMFIPSFPAKFGFFYGFNNSDDGVYLINSGHDDISLTNHVEGWNYRTNLTYWSTEYGNMLNGTDGVFFHPGMKTTETVYAFSTDICRSLPFAYETPTSIRSIKSYRYHTTQMAFANTTVNPDNAAFCVPAGHCMDSGVLNISVCKENAPIVISSPHFYMGAEKYINGVNGLNPNKEEHETYLDIEPTTGTTLQAQKRLQLNVQLEKSEYTDQLKNVKETTFPFLWLNESVYIDQSSAKHLRGVLMLKGFVLAIPYVLFGISALLIIFVGVSLYFQKKKFKKGAPLLNDVDNDGI